MAWQPLGKESDNNYDVIIIGAGISGVNFAYRVQERNPNLSFCVLEGRHEMGGTWSLFKYPGIRSDSDLFTFGFPWRPWSERTSIAQGDLIADYVKESAKSAGLDKKIKYNHRVEAADYSSAANTWTLNVLVNQKENQTFKARWVLLCTGYYDYEVPLQTKIPGIENFKGQVIHPQFWPEKLDYSNKDVVVIGSGATAITVLPVMSETAKHVTMLQRSPSYILSVPTEDAIERFIRRFFWWSLPLQHALFRIKWILAPLFLTTYSKHFPDRVRYRLGQLAGKQLPPEIKLDPHFTPTYNPWEQRMCMCPDGDFYKCLKDGKAGIVTDTIKTVTADTIQLTSGQELRPDIIVTATGLKLRFAGGLKVSVDGKPYTVPDKYVWKGLMLEGLPNIAFVIGYVDASWTLGADATAQLVCRMFSTMAKEGVVQVTPKRTEDDLKNLKEAPMLKLNSTYISKGESVIPKAGDRGQWVPRSNYIKDIWVAWYGDIKGSSEWVRAKN